MTAIVIKARAGPDPDAETVLDHPVVVRSVPGRLHLRRPLPGEAEGV